MVGVGSDAHWGLGGIIDKSVQKFENYRHMLNADSDGGGGQIQMGAKGGWNKMIKCPEI